jgi:TRAP-type C4-dicarboxylate transport system permease small subunit
MKVGLEMGSNINKYLKYLAMICGISVYFMFRYLPYKLQIIIPLLGGIFFIMYMIYTIKQGKTLLEVIPYILLGIGGIIVGIGHYVFGTLHNEGYENIIIMSIPILFALIVVFRLISIYKNPESENFKMLRTVGILTLVFLTIVTISLIFILY